MNVPRFIEGLFGYFSAHIPLYLYPFLHTVSKTRPFEYLRLTSLGVIGALVKSDGSDVIQFLLTTEIIPLCLRIMETGSELSKTVYLLKYCITVSCYRMFSNGTWKLLFRLQLLSCKRSCWTTLACRTSARLTSAFHTLR